MQSLQFFLYYVFCPFMWGGGSCYMLLMHTDWVWHWLTFWVLAWLVWPIGPYRRDYQDALIEEYEEECRSSGEINRAQGLLLALGPVLVMLLAAYTSLLAVPVGLEQYLGIDVDARLEEIQRNAEGNRHPEPPEIPSGFEPGRPELRVPPVP